MSDRVPRPRSLMSRLAGALGTGLVVAFWVGLAPTSIGGDYSYVIVNGSSMEPHLESGDIVLLRREASYGLDEVVAYRDPMIGPVLHRIRSKPDDRFVMRGDNRTTVDNYKPLPSDVLGREVAVWHRGLAVILTVTSPLALGALAFAVLAAGFGMYAAVPAGPVYRRRSAALRVGKAR